MRLSRVFVCASLIVLNGKLSPNISSINLKIKEVKKIITERYPAKFGMKLLNSGCCIAECKNDICSQILPLYYTNNDKQCVLILKPSFSGILIN